MWPLGGCSQNSRIWSFVRVTRRARSRGTPQSGLLEGARQEPTEVAAVAAVAEPDVGLALAHPARQTQAASLNLEGGPEAELGPRLVRPEVVPGQSPPSGRDQDRGPGGSVPTKLRTDAARATSLLRALLVLTDLEVNR